MGPGTRLVFALQARGLLHVMDGTAPSGQLSGHSPRRRCEWRAGWIRHRDGAVAIGSVLPNARDWQALKPLRWNDHSATSLACDDQITIQLQAHEMSNTTLIKLSRDLYLRGNTRRCDGSALGTRARIWLLGRDENEARPTVPIESYVVWLRCASSRAREY